MASRPDRRGSRLENVQGLRAIAALLVLGLHTAVLEHAHFGAPALFGWLIPLGNWGVDMFFVISGFVMVTSTWDHFGERGIGGAFLLRRVTRIVPIYWIVLIPMTVLYLVKPATFTGPEALHPNLVASFLLLPQNGMPLLTVSWTLVFEMYFYYVFALIVGRSRRLAPWLIGGWAAFTIVLHLVWQHPPNPFVRMLTNTITLEFIIGTAIGAWYMSGRRMAWALPAIVAGAAAIAVAAVTAQELDEPTTLLGAGARFAVVGIPMAAIFYGVVGLEVRKVFIAPRAVVALGNASYSLYLVHLPVLSVLLRSAQRARPHFGELHGFWMAAFLLVPIATALLLYRFVERPLVKALARLIGAHASQATVPSPPLLAPKDDPAFV